MVAYRHALTMAAERTRMRSFAGVSIAFCAPRVQYVQNGLKVPKTMLQREIRRPLRSGAAVASSFDLLGCVGCVNYVGLCPYFRVLRILLPGLRHIGECPAAARPRLPHFRCPYSPCEDPGRENQAPHDRYRGDITVPVGPRSSNVSPIMGRCPFDITGPRCEARSLGRVLVPLCVRTRATFP